MKLQVMMNQEIYFEDPLKGVCRVKQGDKNLVHFKIIFWYILKASIIR